MREIKFRAWIFGDIDDMDAPFMEEVALLEWEDLGGRLLAHWTTHDEVSIVEKECHLMQYTGLKDKNGKEIYEGDYLSNINGIKFEMKWEKRGWTHYSPKDVFEVIGNIYENPDLIK